MRGGQAVTIDPVTDRADFAGAPGSPAWEQLAGPRSLADHPPAVVNVAPVIPLPVPPGTVGRLVRLPGGRLGMSPSNLLAPVVPSGPGPINVDPPPGQAIIQGQPDGTLAVAPLPLSFGGDDAGQINEALLQGPTVRLRPGTFNIKSTVNVPWNSSLIGHRAQTFFNYSGNGSAVFMQDPAVSQPPVGSRHEMAGSIEHIIIDGTNAGANAILLDVRDIHFGTYLDVVCQNATGVNAVGCQLANQNISMNGLFGVLSIVNCTTGILINSLGAQNAIEHLNMTWHIGLGAGQNGIHLANSVGVQGSRLNVDIGSSVSAAGIGLIMETGTAFQTCSFDYKHEMNPAPGTSQSVQFLDPSAHFTNCEGILFFGANLLDATGITVPSVNSQFQFHGPVIGDPVLISAMSSPVGSDLTAVTVQTPAVPASGTPVNNNNGVAVWVTLAGGTITAAAQISGPGTVGDTTTRTYLLPSSQTITLHYSAAPTWTWQPV
jgi:hypothetical protein